MLQQTLVVPALPTLQRELGASTTWVTGVFTGSLLTSAVATPLLGELGDTYGKFGNIRDELPRERVGLGPGLLSATFGAGSGAGLVLSGLILDTLSWQWLGCSLIVPTLVQLPSGLPDAVAAQVDFGFGASVTVAGLSLLPSSVVMLLVGPSRAC